MSQPNPNENVTRRCTPLVLPHVGIQDDYTKEWVTEDGQPVGFFTNRDAVEYLMNRFGSTRSELYTTVGFTWAERDLYFGNLAMDADPGAVATGQLEEVTLPTDGDLKMSGAWTLLALAIAVTAWMCLKQASYLQMTDCLGGVLAMGWLSGVVTVGAVYCAFQAQRRLPNK